jgi:hypothetical protein
MEESSSAVPFRLDNTSFIGFPSSDGHPLFGIYPPICNKLNEVIVTRLDEHGQLVVGERHNRSWFKEEARIGNVAILSHAVLWSPNRVILCVPDERREILEPHVELHAVQKRSVYAGLIDLQNGYPLFWNIASDHRVRKDPALKIEIFSMMLACGYLTDAAYAEKKERLVRSLYLNHDVKQTEQLEQYIRIFLARFGRVYPKKRRTSPPPA